MEKINLASPFLPVPDGDRKPSKREKQVAREKVEAIICFFPDIGGGLLG